MATPDSVTEEPLSTETASLAAQAPEKEDTNASGESRDKSLKSKDIHHLDASGTAQSQASLASLAHGYPSLEDSWDNLFNGSPSTEVDQPIARGNGVVGDSGHSVAPTQNDLPSKLEVLSVLERVAVERTPSRPSSPGLVHSSASSRKASSQGYVWNSAEIETSLDGLPRSLGGVNDSFTQQIMAGAMRLKTSLFKPERISFSDIARNPNLARRARAEMDNHQFRGMIEGPDGTLLEGRPHDLEVTRLQVALDVVEADADEEAKINSQQAQLVCMRLDASRKAVERLLGILQAVTAAEAAYTRTMNAVSRVKLVSECDGHTLRAALSRFSDIPWLVGEAHAAIQNGLVEITRSCQEVVLELRKECQSLTFDASRAQSAVLSARKALHHAFLTHKSACNTTDEVFLERSRTGKTGSTRLELDPWLTESRVVAAHQALHAAQTHQRRMLETAYERVRHHEEHRCEILKEIVDSFLHSYRGDLGPDPQEEESLRSLMDVLNWEEDLQQFTASAAAAVDMGNQLAERQSAALEAASQDLLCSPDIIRQGRMARWVSGTGKWADCLFILTRSGFLYWLAEPQDVSPQGSMRLSRCQFEAGEAPKFNINEHQGGLFSKGKRMCFQAPSVEECCEWAIALREIIAAHKVR